MTGSIHSRAGDLSRAHLVRATVRAWRRRLLVSLLELLAPGCERASTSMSGTLERVGLADAPTPEAAEYVLLCDRTATPCGAGALGPLLRGLGREMASRPGASLSLWMQGESPAQTRLLGTVHPEPLRAGASDRARQRAVERTVEEVEGTLCRRLDAALAAPPPRRSPILESVAKVALSRRRDLPLRLYVLSDLRQHSPLGDWECASRLPTVSQFLTVVDRQALLATDALSRAEVIFVVGDRRPPAHARCEVSVARERHVQNLLGEALRHAGATRVEFLAEPPRFAQSAPRRAL